MKFKTDENLPVEVVALLRREGRDVLSVVDQQLAGHSDADVAAACQAEERALVTLDLDFSNIRSYPPDGYRQESFNRGDGTRRRAMKPLVSVFHPRFIRGPHFTSRRVLGRRSAAEAPAPIPPRRPFCPQPVDGL